MYVNNTPMRTIAATVMVCLAGIALSAHAATAATVQATSVTAASFAHMPLASQVPSATARAANSPTPQAIRVARAIQAFGSRTPAGVPPHTAVDAACIIMLTPVGHAFLTGDPAGDASDGAYALTGI